MTLPHKAEVGNLWSAGHHEVRKDKSTMYSGPAATEIPMHRDSAAGKSAKRSGQAADKSNMRTGPAAEGNTMHSGLVDIAQWLHRRRASTVLRWSAERSSLAKWFASAKRLPTSGIDLCYPINQNSNRKSRKYPSLFEIWVNKDPVFPVGAHPLKVSENEPHTQPPLTKQP